MLQQLGFLRLFLIDTKEIVHQCLGQTETGIDHHFSGACSCKQPCSRWPYVVVTGCAILVLVVVVYRLLPSLGHQVPPTARVTNGC